MTRKASRSPPRSPTTCCRGRPRFPISASCTCKPPRPYTRFGQKGLGEGGAIAPPAAITNAINDALKDLGAELLISPATPRRIAEAVDRARSKATA